MLNFSNRSANYNVNIVLTNDHEIITLNSRNTAIEELDAPTNVLSFPSTEDAKVRIFQLTTGTELLAKLNSVTSLSPCRDRSKMKPGIYWAISLSRDCVG